MYMYTAVLATLTCSALGVVVGYMFGHAVVNPVPWYMVVAAPLCLVAVAVLFAIELHGNAHFAIESNKRYHRRDRRKRHV